MSVDSTPPTLIDPGSLPPPLLTSEPGSFAQHTLADRIPRILEETIEHNRFPGDIVDDLWALHRELRSGHIRPLAEETPDAALWRLLAEPYIGRSWLDVPWFFAETYYYRRVLEVTRYFRPGPTQGHDPYAATKDTEWQPDAAPAAVETLLAGLPTDLDAAFAAVLQASLWGNRIDLSYRRVIELAARSGDDSSEDLIVDHSQGVWRHLAGHDQPTVVLIADNAGTELSMDLALIDLLLSRGLAGEVVLHVKPQPFFVSDAMDKDVYACLTALDAGGGRTQALAARLREHLAVGRLRTYTHWFYPTSLFYFQLPSDFHVELARAALVILKGDLNYRRLFGDAHWSPTANFAAAAGYFPTSLVTLRTLKSELILGLPSDLPERLAAEDPQWLVNGRRGVVQFRA